MGVAGASGQVHIRPSRRNTIMRMTSEEPVGAPTTSGKLNQRVRRYWDKEPCGTGPAITQQLEPRSSKWFEQIDPPRDANEAQLGETANEAAWRSTSKER